MLAGLYITPNGFTVARNFSSTNRCPILSAKHDPTNSIRSHGGITNSPLSIFTIVLNSISPASSYFTKVIQIKEKQNIFINFFLRIIARKHFSGRGYYAIHTKRFCKYCHLFLHIKDTAS